MIAGPAPAAFRRGHGEDAPLRTGVLPVPFEATRGAIGAPDGHNPR